ncbi:MAG: fumarylacetoacetate hydrolase family protein [Nitrososphaerales archaeon]
MRLVTYSLVGEDRIGAYTERGIVDLKFAYKKYNGGSMETIFEDMRRLLYSGDVGLSLAREVIDSAMRYETGNQEGSNESCIVERGYKLRAPITKPDKIMCPAVNYVEHGKESGVAPPSEPYFFGKFVNSIIGQDDTILIPSASKMPDYEVELAAVIGKKGKHISKERAYGYVAGYTILNDISFRDLQGWPRGHPVFGSHWLIGKSADTACPMGPWMVTRDELPNVYPLRIKLSVNGIVKQSSDTSLQVFKIPEMIEFLSRVITLEPGDIISTGTPSGVGRTTGIFLKEGDIVEAEIENIGVLRNNVRDEKL